MDIPGRNRFPRPNLNPWAMGSLILFTLCGLGAVLSGFGSRWGWWSFGFGFSILRWSVYGAGLTVIISMVGIYRSQAGRKNAGIFLAGLALLGSIVIVAIPVHWYYTAQSVPPIHDITTDTENPPTFKTVLPLRKDAPNSTEYGGNKIARQQKQAYPEIKPLDVNSSRQNVFSRILSVARAMGWTIHSVDSQTGRIEATDRTFWFGFKDDIVIRISSNDSSIRVDVRSVSRVGKSDVGTNARRIRQFLNTLKKRLK